MSDRQIHINRAGQAYGPYPEGRAREMLAAGQVFATDFAWYEGAAEWKSLSDVLGPTPAAAQPTPPSPPKPAAGGAPKRQLAGSKPEEEKDDPDKIHVTRKGEPIGPYSREKAKEYFIAGTLLPTDWGWYDGMGEGWKPLNEVLELPVKSTKTSSENSGSSTSIYGIKKKKTSSTKPFTISDKAISWISWFAFFIGLFGTLFLAILGGFEGPVRGWDKVTLYGAGLIAKVVVWVLLNIINEILKRM